MDDRSALSGTDGLNVPCALRPDVEEIVVLTDELCAEQDECRRRGLIPDLAAGA